MKKTAGGVVAQGAAQGAAKVGAKGVGKVHSGDGPGEGADDGSGDGGDNAQARFGTFGGVFTPCVLTILGVIMFMRTGYVVGQSGLWLALAILGLSKLITTLTTLSLSAVATNLDMRVGGVYFTISRVLGPDFGGSIGITLFLAQAVSVAFYVIGFTEALLALVQPLLDTMATGGVTIPYLAPIVATVATSGLFFLTFRGADLAIKAQYVVLAVLLVGVASFLVGGALQFDPANLDANTGTGYTGGVGFWTVFAIFFPAATGITAGANLSGDLKNPKRSIPWGTLGAIVFTAAIYGAQMVLSAGATPRGDLVAQPFLALQKMSVFAPLVMAGVFAATLSSALGSFLGAPRILQAMGQDRLVRPLVFFGRGAGPTNEPRRATVLTFVIAIGVIWAGDLDAVAEVISMFFLIAYGMINLSAFVEARGSNPSFRPSFRLFHWSTALVGAIGCAVVMVKINETYALVATAIVGALYFYLRKLDIQAGWGDAKRGYIFQRARDSLLYLERSRFHPKNWRPLIVAVTDDARRDDALVQMTARIESRRGLYTVAEILERAGLDLPNKLAIREAGRDDLVRQLETEDVVAFSEVVVVDDFENGLTTFLQSYSIGGLRPNTVALALPPAADTKRRATFLRAVGVASSFHLNLVVLKGAPPPTRKRARRIDLWWRGEKNGSLMALFSWLIRLDSDFSGARLRVLRVAGDEAAAAEAARHLDDLRRKTRIEATIQVVRSEERPQDVIAAHSADADLVFLGMAAANAEQASAFLRDIEPLLQRLPTTLLVWSNGEADAFA